jgi:HD-GYP domain-containing protein (c-di-GMP phosphodiesterase class II)/HAMP domain-containing protein
MVATTPFRGVSLRFAVALLLMVTVLATGAILGVHNYRQTSRLVLEASDEVFERTGREVVLALGQTAAPARSLVDVLAAQSIAEARSVDERARHVPALAEALRGNPSLTAIYVGYSDGAFFLVRPASDARTRSALRAPESTAFIVQSVESTPEGMRTSFHYLRDDLTTIEVVPRPDFVFDPRSRDWYRAAMGSARQIRTDPYVFFTTHEPGITLARASPARRAVVGADLTLDKVSTLLQNQQVGPATELYLLTADGRVLARRGAMSLTQGDAASGGLRLSALREAGGAAASTLAQRLADDTRKRNFTFEVGGATWIGGFDAIDNDDGAPLFLAVASPTEELLAGARRILTQGWIVTLLLILAATPLAWLAASRVSAPLRRLADVARRMQAFDFADDPPARSAVREIDQLERSLAEGKATVRRFLDLSGALAAERDLDRLVARVLGETMQLAKADAASIHMRDASRRELAPVKYVRRDAQDDGATLAPIPLGTADGEVNPIARAVATGRTVLVDAGLGDVGARAWLGREADAIGTEHIGMLVVPLRDRVGAVDGALCVMSGAARADAVSPQVIAFVENLSGVAAIAIETRRLIAEQKALLEAFIQLIAAAIDAKSPYTGGHCQRVPELTKMLARAACDAKDGPFRDFALDEDQWEAVHIASWLHDCGKVTTPEYVVDKATKLETICDRIHEIRTRFEVLKRDAEIAYWKGRAEGGDPAALREALTSASAALDADFAFVARCNEGGESLAAEDVERLHRIAARTWQRTLDDRLGVSWEERKRMERRPPAPLPATEPLLADKPAHIIERDAGERIPAGNRWGFRLRVPPHRYDRGELHNLAIGRGTLTDEERYKINDHIVQTIVMLENLPFPRHLAQVPEIAGGHHEKLDGTGYPRGLTRDRMSPVARMMAIADVFEALTAVDRPYKKGKTLAESLAIMARMRSDRHIDPDLFELFLTAGVYRRYAERFLRPEQIDDVDVERLLARA